MLFNQVRGISGRGQAPSRGFLEEASFGIEDLEGAASVAFLNSVRGWRQAVLV